MNTRSELLYHNYLWAKELSNEFTETTVITHKNPVFMDKKDYSLFTMIISLGNYKRILQLIQLLVVACTIIKNRKNSVVFYHMAVYPASVLSPILSVFRVRQVLWYSHSHKSIPLHIASLFVNEIITPTPNSFPLNLTKVTSIGHGITFSEHLPALQLRTKSKILILGRISKIKNIELLILLVSQFNSFSNSIELDLFGPILNKSYFDELMNFAKDKNVVVNYNGALKPNEVFEQISAYSLAYNGMVNSVDKSALEVTAQGCLLISPFEETLMLSGMKYVYPKPMNTKAQFEYLLSLTESELEVAQRTIMEESRRKNYYKNTILIIVSILRGEKNTNVH